MKLGDSQLYTSHSQMPMNYSSNPLQSQLLRSQAFMQQQNAIIQKQNLEIQQLKHNLLESTQNHEQGNYDELRMQFENLKKQYQFMVTEQEKESQATKNQLQKLEESNSQLQSYVTQLRAKNQQLVQKAKQIKQSYDDLVDEYDQQEEKYEKYKNLSIQLAQKLKVQKSVVLNASQQIQKLSAQPIDVLNQTLCITELNNLKFQLNSFQSQLSILKRSLPQLQIPSAQEIVQTIRNVYRVTEKQQYSLPAAQAIAVSRLAQASVQIQQQIGGYLNKYDYPQFQKQFQLIFGEIIAKLQIMSAQTEIQAADESVLLKASQLLKCE